MLWEQVFLFSGTVWVDSNVRTYPFSIFSVLTPWSLPGSQRRGATLTGMYFVFGSRGKGVGSNCSGTQGGGGGGGGSGRVQLCCL